MSTPAILAKAIFDNLADASDELSFRKGDIVTVIEQDVDGLIGWWLCSLHGRQGIAPGNRLQQIKRRDEGEDQVQSAEVFTFEDVDYDTPRSQEEGEDYDVPRGIMSPDYDIPTDNELVDYAVPKGFVKDSGLVYLTGQEAESESQQLYDVPISDPLLKESEQKLADNVQFIVNTEERLPEDIYDIPQHNASEVQGVFIQQNNQRDFAHLDQTKEAVGELYDVPNKEASVKEMYSQQPVIVKEDKELYAEIYDVPTQTEQDNRNSLERHLKGTPAANDGSVNVRVQEKRDSRELAKLRKPANAVGHLSISSSDGDRQSTSSTDSGKVGFEDDDYVDYQEIYGDGKENVVNVYDVPVQPIPLSQDKDIRNSPSTKRTQVSILQQINMKAVKGVNLDPAVALQRLTKLEHAVNGTAQKLLRFVTTTWRDPTILKSHLADIRDTTGKAKVALRLLTEFALSSLVNARSLPTQELSGKLSRAVEPLLETYYSVKLALQRLDDQDWRTPLEKSSSTHDDLDLIMVHIRSVPENSHKLAGIIRTGATTLYKKKPSLASELTSTSSQTKRPAANKAAHEKTNTSDLNSTRSGEIAVSPVTSATKETADGNFKAKADGSKWSPTTLRWVCGVDNRNGDGFGVNGSEGSAVPSLPSRLQSSYDKTKNGVSSEEPRTPPLPPQRKDSGKKCHHLRQKSLEKFPTDGLGNEAPGPPPKPKLDRKRTARKSYKVPLFAERKQMQEEVVLREHKGSETEPSTPRRKCNSDPSQLKESISADMSPVEEHTETTNILQIRKQSTVHISDSDLPQSLKESSKVRSMASQFEKVENSSVSSQRAVHDVLEHRPLSNLIKGVDLTNGVMVSLNDRELLEFYKYEIDAQLFVLSEAIKGFFAVVDRNESPKVFVSNSKFIVLSAHKFVYIGDTLSKKISDSDLRSDVISVTNKLSGGIKMLVSATKSAALQYPASSAMREMSDSVLVVNDNAIELHRIVKKTTN